MSVWHSVRMRRAAGALAATALAVTLAGCGSGGGQGDQGDGPSASATSNPSGQSAQGQSGSTPSPSPSETLATLQGTGGFQMVIQSAVRDEGGFLTISGVIKNTTDKVTPGPVQWSGSEPQVKAQGQSLAGMTLEDAKEKKIYYVLRDTDGNPLTTTSDFNFQPDESMPFFAQFPAPPATTTEVGVEMPTMSTATIAIS
jgi:hypothetical protein